MTGILEPFPYWPWCTNIAHNNLQTGVEYLSKSKYSAFNEIFLVCQKKCIYEIWGKLFCAETIAFIYPCFFIGIRYHIDIRPCICVVFQPSFHWVKPQHLHEDNRKNCYTTNPRTSSHAMEFSYTDFFLRGGPVKNTLHLHINHKTAALLKERDTWVVQACFHMVAPHTPHWLIILPFYHLYTE